MVNRMIPFVVVLAACGGSTASVEGTAGDVSWGDTDYVYVGSRYIVVSGVEIDCRDIDWIDRTYDDGVNPAGMDVATLQFTFASGDAVEAGKFSIAKGAAVQSTIVHVSGDTTHIYDATSGILQVDSTEDGGTTTGSFDSVVFDDGGTLSGTFTAQWCVNLKS